MTRTCTLLSAAWAVAMLSAGPGPAGEGDARPRSSTVRGEISGIDGSAVTVAVRREGRPVAQQTLTVNDDTQIEIEAIVAVSDVKAGQYVEVWRDGRRVIGGKVSKVEGNVLTIPIRREGQAARDETVTIDAGAQTITGVAGKLSDLKVGQRLAARHSEGVAIRMEVMIARPRRPGGEGEGGSRRGATVVGELTKIDGAAITITSGGDGGPRETTVSVGADTSIGIEAVIGLADVKVGQYVGIWREGRRVIGGKVSKIEGNVLTIPIKREGQPARDETVTIGASTEIVTEAAGKLADLKVGQYLAARYRDGGAIRIEVVRRPPARRGREGQAGTRPAPVQPRRREGER